MWSFGWSAELVSTLLVLPGRIVLKQRLVDGGARIRARIGDGRVYIISAMPLMSEFICAPRLPTRRPGRSDAKRQEKKEECAMVALVALLLILAIFGGLGFAAHVLWFVLVIAVVLWLLGFVVGGVDAGVGRRRWYGRW
jgi:hypothetical protein